MFDFRQLRYFIAVAEELSFTRAAIRLHLSQPPLSQQIQSLEKDLGVRLLERNRRKVALTAPGELFLLQARQILASADIARTQVIAAAAGYRGQLRVAYTVSVSFHPSFPRTLLRYQQIAPDVRLQLCEKYTQAQYTALLDDEIDVGFVRDKPGPAQDPGRLRVVEIAREPMLIALPAAHPLAGRAKLQMKELAHDKFVCQPRELTSTCHDRLLKLANGAGFEPVIVQQAEQLNGMLALVAAGMGVALVPASMQAMLLEGVCYVPLEDPDAFMLLAAASRADDHSPTLQHFLSTVAEIAKAGRLVGAAQSC